MLQQFCHKCLHKINIPKLLQNLEYTSDNPRRTVEKIETALISIANEFFNDLTSHCTVNGDIVTKNWDKEHKELCTLILMYHRDLYLNHFCSGKCRSPCQQHTDSLLFYSSWLLPSYWRVACQNFGTEFVTPPAFKNKDHMFYLT